MLRYSYPMMWNKYHISQFTIPNPSLEQCDAQCGFKRAPSFIACSERCEHGGSDYVGVETFKGVSMPSFTLITLQISTAQRLTFNFGSTFFIYSWLLKLHVAVRCSVS